ncbi:MAG TPA: acyltransferase [Bryobacteraceae bacterium]|jgi:peptidoglycan/LPS O-acetylase OafA/YrhL
MERVPELDGVRGIAILFVLIAHFGAPLAPWGPLRELLGAGRYGVDLFFVLSGYLITGILLETRGQANYFKRFYLRRVFRIFPIYYLYLGLYFAVVGRTRISPLWYMAYVSNWRDARLQPSLLLHFWSLAIEEQFYLVWPLIVLLVPRPALKYASMAMAAASPIAIWIAAPYGLPVSVINRGTVFHLTPIALGCLLAALKAKPPNWKPFRMRWLVDWGRYSYGAYVWHPIALAAVVRLLSLSPSFWRMGASLLIGIPLTYALARLSWWLIENPFALVKERLTEGLRGRTNKTPAVAHAAQR